VAKTGPPSSTSSWQEKNGRCGECGLEFGIGAMVEHGKTKVITDLCPNPVCDGSATVTLQGE